MDIDKNIRMAVDTGKVIMGYRSVSNALTDASLKLVIIASNSPKEFADAIKEKAKVSNIPVYVYEGTSIDLGSACGRPFPVSFLGILEQGNSALLDLAKSSQ
ncbi:MAG: 50S ribosomal protein L30e [Candidatus Micrarchaeia archaeon]